MALDATKWEIRSDKKVRYVGGVHGNAAANYVTVLELHRFLQDRADDGTMSADDFIDISVLNPTDKKFETIIQLLNGFELDDAYTTPASEFIYGGSIIQGTGGSEAIYDGISIIANRGVVVNVIQNNAVLANKFWNNTPSGESFNGINPDEANGLAMQFMVKIKTAGAFIDNASLIFTTREWGKTFSEFRIPATGRGKNSVPLTYSDDLNNVTAIGTIAALADITNVTSGFNLIDVDNNTVNEEYYSEWNRGANSINIFYEYMKWLTRNGYTTTLYGIAGERFRGITHEIVVDTPTGTFSAFEAVSWSGGTGQMLAINSTTAPTKMWIQLLTGVAPTDNQTITGGGSGATCLVNVTVTSRALSTPFCGQSTGTSLVGSYGFALESADLAVNDKITALDGTTRQPPNNVTFTVSGVASGWRVLVGPENGSGGLLESQLSNTNLLSGATVTAVEVDEAIPANTPSGDGVNTTIRIKRADGRFTRHVYSAVNTGTKTFTIASHDFSTNNASIGADIYISYIDAAASGATIAFSTIQSGGAQTLYVSARFGGTGPNYTDSIKPAATTGSLGTTGGSATISSVSDA
ncbi:MAG: hypothetical protein A3G46_01630 [Candidatus Zambryskibacteria bacterium RIFCSPLOWO2_12_FULL_39_16]|uniref:Uncharacterized protein n=1 Tax=Candidatus Zambryskibacteria bacterium RIFCSPLOWO2_12_FULL_39_16 TaxID=1802775 RepID=A0A1G2UU48_9BACT|nr:MAG: hypothetical protein A3G46_01630 [Candidatus Zambryskibacteria bacterium RIFCSPLOWO2_12_FULL_39_16]